MTELILTSSDPGSFLAFSNFNGAYFDFRIEALSLAARKSVYNYKDYGPAEFFQRLATFECPWPGLEAWEAIEGDLKLAATCDVLGHVKLDVTLGNLVDWNVRCELMFDLGQLPKMARSTQLFFNEKTGG